MRASKQAGVPIAIAGRLLDGVQIRQNPPWEPGKTSFLSYPVSQHWAKVSATSVQLGVPALAVVQLFADGTLPHVRERAVALEIDGRAFGRWLLVLVEQCRSSQANHVLLTFERASE